MSGKKKKKKRCKLCHTPAHEAVLPTRHRAAEAPLRSVRELRDPLAFGRGGGRDACERNQPLLLPAQSITVREGAGGTAPGGGHRQEEANGRPLVALLRTYLYFSTTISKTGNAHLFSVTSSHSLTLHISGCPRVAAAATMKYQPQLRLVGRFCGQVTGLL